KAMRVDEAVVFPEERAEPARDDLGVHLIGVGVERDAIAFADALQHLLHAGNRPVEEVAPELVKLADVAAVVGLVAKEVIELPEGDRAALHVPIAARRL